MREPVKIVVIAVALLFFASATAWSEKPKISEADIDKLCEIHSKQPLTKMIRINHATRPRIRPVVVHRCQEITFKVDRGKASIAITDKDISNANKEDLRPEVDGVVSDTIVLWVRAGDDGATIRVPRDYPNPERIAFVRYYTECHDPDSNVWYECEGTSPPMIIIPPTRP